MKNRNLIRILVLALALVMMLSIVSCNSDEPTDKNDPTEAPTSTPTEDPGTEHVHAFGDPVETKAPTCTDKGEKTATCECGETKKTEIDALGHDYKDGVCSVCGEADPEAPHTHVFGDAVETKAPTCTEKGEKTAECECGETQITEIDALGHDYKDGACSVCGEVDPNATHEHSYVNGICECGDIPTVTSTSRFDADGDNVNDTFYFSPIIPDAFTGDGVYHIAASDYDQTLSSGSSSSEQGGLTHYYITENTDGCLVYKITVEESGVYELAIHLRMKDTKERGTTYTLNEGTLYEYSFSTSFKLNDDELALARNNGDAMSSYMYGIFVNLKAGENTIKIEHADACEKSQHYRDLYLLHRLSAWNPVFNIDSTYDADGDGANDVFSFSSKLPYEFTADDTVHVWAGDYDQALSSNFKKTTNADSTGIDHWYIQEYTDGKLVYKVTVAEAGVYDLAIHLRLKDTKVRGTNYTVNPGTAGEYSFKASFSFDSQDEVNFVRDADTSSAYMFGIQVTLNEGDNYIQIEHAAECEKSPHYRDFYFIKADS